jgi:hypothetical protein
MCIYIYTCVFSVRYVDKLMFLCEYVYGQLVDTEYISARLWPTIECISHMSSISANHGQESVGFNRCWMGLN